MGKANVIGGVLFLVLYAFVAVVFHIQGDKALMVLFALFHIPITELFVKMNPWLSSLGEIQTYALFLTACGALWFLAGWILGYPFRFLGWAVRRAFRKS